MSNDVVKQILKPSEVRPWLKYYPQKSVERALPHCTIYQYLKSKNSKHLNENAINYFGTNITYDTLFKRIERCADAFYSIGVREGDIVSYVSVSIPETVVAMYALNKIGAVSNFIDPRMDIDSIKRVINNVKSDTVIIVDLAFPKLKAIMKDVKPRMVIVQSPADSLNPIAATVYKAKNPLFQPIPYCDTIISWKDFVRKMPTTPAVEAPYKYDSVSCITYTGGTTGFPKGAMLTNDGMNAVAFNFKYAGIHYVRGQRFLDVIPVFASYGVVCGIHMPLILGITDVIIPKLNVAELGKIVKKYKPCHMIAVPAYYEAMMSSKELRNEDLSFFITLGSGGDSMNKGLEEKLHKWLRAHNAKYPLAQGYGMSEISSAVSFCFNDIYKSGSVGIPSLTTTVGIFAPGTTDELGFGEEGEICITGPSMMKGYFNDQAETDNIMKKHPDGKIWIHSGDIGYMDVDGFLYIKNRIKHIIIRFDGHKVFPINMETYICNHPMVKNCSVIGVKDKDHMQGFLPMAVVELKHDLPEGTDVEAVRKEIFESCNRDLEERGRPCSVVLIDEIPLTSFGKNDVMKLSKMYENYDY